MISANDKSALCQNQPGFLLFQTKQAEVVANDPESPLVDKITLLVQTSNLVEIPMMTARIVDGSQIHLIRPALDCAMLTHGDRLKSSLKAASGDNASLKAYGAMMRDLKGIKGSHELLSKPIKNAANTETCPMVKQTLLLPKPLLVDNTYFNEPRREDALILKLVRLIDIDAPQETVRALADKFTTEIADAGKTHPAVAEYCQNILRTQRCYFACMEMSVQGTMQGGGPDVAQVINGFDDLDLGLG